MRRARRYDELELQRQVNRDLGPLFASVPYQKASNTSQEAADELSGEKVARLRAAVLNAFIVYGPMTPDQCADKIGESVLAVRPRCSEWTASGHLEKTKERRTNASGLSARVLRRPPVPHSPSEKGPDA
jgi:hypothetical protein